MFESVISKLQSTYDSAGPYYLSNFFLPNGEKTLYNFLASVHKSIYENNFRILVVQDCVDEYTYKNTAGRALTVLQQQLSKIDISNFFVIVITANPNIVQELEHVKKLYSTDDYIMQSYVSTEFNYLIEYKKSNTFCILPWTHLYIGTDGNILPCCNGDQNYPMGNIEKESIKNIVNSQRFTQLRSNMLNNQKSIECSQCYDQEAQGLTSLRQQAESRWENTDLNFSSNIDMFTPKSIDIRLNNLCNLKCRMCSGYFSSAIAQEEKELFKIDIVINSTLNSKQRNTYLNEILNYASHVEQIYFAGGEPLLTSEHYDILTSLINCCNIDLEIFYNTNFTNLQYKNISVLDFWKKFTNITIGASLDAIGPVAEYVRHGTDWKQIESNLDLVKKHCPTINFTVTSTVGLLNVASLIDLQTTWHNSNRLDISKFSLSVMSSPAHLTVAVLPIHHKQRLEKLIKAHIKWCQHNYAQKLADKWNDVLTYMWSDDASYQLEEFNRLTTTMDIYRQESFVNTFPELSDLINNKVYNKT